MTEMKWAGWVCRHELYDERAILSLVGTTVMLVLSEELQQSGGDLTIAQSEVQEPRAGYFHRLNAGRTDLDPRRQFFRNCARWFTQGRSQGERHVGREVPVARVLGLFETYDRIADAHLGQYVGERLNDGFL